LLDGATDSDDAYLAGTFHSSRTANQLALKWRDIKTIMMKDITGFRALNKGGKIMTKHEWMMSALDLLERHDK
jgi:hypothetical protein